MEEGNSTSSMNEQLVSVVDTPMKEKNDDFSPTAIVLQHVTCDVLRANNAVANDAFTANNSACTSTVNEAHSANRTAWKTHKARILNSPELSLVTTLPRRGNPVVPCHQKHWPKKQIPSLWAWNQIKPPNCKGLQDPFHKDHHKEVLLQKLLTSPNSILMEKPFSNPTRSHVIAIVSNLLMNRRYHYGIKQRPTRMLLWTPKLRSWMR